MTVSWRTQLKATARVESTMAWVDLQMKKREEKMGEELVGRLAAR